MDDQLVLQFRGGSMPNFNALIALEDALISELGDSANVDEYDIGAGVVNIFIITSVPEQTFQQIRPILEREQRLQAVTVVYRRLDGEQFTVV